MLAGFSVQYFAKLKRTPRWLNWWSRCFPNLQLSNKLLATTLALLILVSGFLSMGIAYSHGMQSYQIPPGLAAAYTRISNDSDNFAVLTSPFTYNYVQNYPTADPWAQTWDFSYYSPVITGKPIWTPIVIDSQSSIFIQYLLHIIRSEQTLDFPKIIGSFGVKYVVLQGITPDITPTGWIFTADQERQFFSAQNGLVPVYSNGNQTVFRDNYYVPPVVASPNYTLVIGGLDALESMAGLANYTFNQNPLIFGSQNTGASFLNLIRNANVLLFQGTEATDLVMLALQSSGTANFISPVDSLANTDQALSWSPFFRPYVDGDYRISDAGVSTSSNSTISTHFSTSTQGQFEIWLHLFVGEDAEAGVALDGKTIALLTPSQLLQPANVGYRWLMVNSTELAPGNHDLSIRAILKDGASLSVDKIAILPTGIYEQEDSNIRTLLSGPNTYPMYVIPAGSYLYAPATQWRLTAFSYNLSSYLFDSSSRLVLSNTSSGFSGWITSTVDLVKSGTYRFMLSALSASQAEFVINIDGYNTTFQVPPSNDFVWSTGPPLQLQEGLHTLQVAVNDRASFDKIVLYPVGLNLSYTPASSSYSEESPTEYLVDIPRGTRVITLSQAYSNLWQASSEGTTLQHVVLSYVTNGFLPGSGTSGPVVIQFEGQQILDISSYITISGLLLPIPMTLYRKRLFNRRST